MKKSDIVKSIVATIVAGISIYGLKKREEKIFKKEYDDLQEEYKTDIEKVSKAYEAE